MGNEEGLAVSVSELYGRASKTDCTNLVSGAALKV
jgi:hypothetical protein